MIHVPMVSLHLLEKKLTVNEDCSSQRLVFTVERHTWGAECRLLPRPAFAGTVDTRPGSWALFHLLPVLSYDGQTSLDSPGGVGAGLDGRLSASERSRC